RDDHRESDSYRAQAHGIVFPGSVQGAVKGATGKTAHRSSDVSRRRGFALTHCSAFCRIGTGCERAGGLRCVRASGTAPDDRIEESTMNEQRSLRATRPMPSAALRWIAASALAVAGAAWLAPSAHA